MIDTEHKTKWWEKKQGRQQQINSQLLSTTSGTFFYCWETEMVIGSWTNFYNVRVYLAKFFLPPIDFPLCPHV
jgi:hypothetical protein